MSQVETDKSSSTAVSDETLVIPIFEETLRVDVREVEERVSVRTKVHERDEVVETMLRGDTLDIERVKLDQVVQTAPSVREEGDLLIIPVLEEVLVVEKRLILREEIRIRRTQQTRPAEQTVRLRREEAIVERSSVTPQHPMETRPNGDL